MTTKEKTKAIASDKVIIALLDSIYRYKDSGLGHSPTVFNRIVCFDSIFLGESTFGRLEFYDRIEEVWVDGDIYIEALFKEFGYERHTH